MTTTTGAVTLHVAPRNIPIPTTVSPASAAFLSALAAAPTAAEADPSQGTTHLGVNPWPSDLSDKEAVAAVIAVIDEAWTTNPDQPAATNFGAAAVDISDVNVEHVMFGDVSVYIATPPGVTDEDPRVYLTIHGAWINAGGEVSRVGAAQTAKILGVRTWAIDYRMPPYHAYPVPLNDSVDAYKAALERYQPGEIAIGGTSGGGNLAMALLLRIHAESLPMPAAAVLNTPYADLAHVGDTFKTNEGIDINFSDLPTVQKLYLAGHDPLDPFVSPINGTFTNEFPPVLLTTGTRDFLLSDTVRLHRKLLAVGVEAELHVWEAATHLFFGGFAPEDEERPQQARRFLDSRWDTPTVDSQTVA